MRAAGETVGGDPWRFKPTRRTSYEHGRAECRGFPSQQGKRHPAALSVAKARYLYKGEPQAKLQYQRWPRQRLARRAQRQLEEEASAAPGAAGAAAAGGGATARKVCSLSRQSEEEAAAKELGVDLGLPRPTQA